MKEYIKPFIEDEEIEIEDICVPSGVVQKSAGDIDEEDVGDSYDSGTLF